MNQNSDDALLGIFNVKEVFFAIKNMPEEDMQKVIKDLLHYNPDWDVYQAKDWVRTVLSCMEDYLLEHHTTLGDTSGPQQFALLSSMLHQ